MQCIWYDDSMGVKLRRGKARKVISVFNNPLQVEMISDLEKMYMSVLDIIGDMGRLNELYYVDVDRTFGRGIFTSCLRLSARLNNKELLDLGEIIDASLAGNELRLEILSDSGTRSAIILYTEENE